MRVLESNAHQSYIMGKKKLRLKHKSNDNISDSSDESIAAEVNPTTGPACSHINRCVNLSAVKKVLKQNVVFGECQACSKDSGIVESSANVELEPLINLDPSIWLCLQCGYQGCDRNSKNKHALNHFSNPQSFSHSLSVSTSSWQVWCYLCDDDVAVENSKKLVECVEFIRRHAINFKSESMPPCKNHNFSCAESNPSDVNDDKTRHNKSKSASLPIFQKVKGLSNLGNTCFFNAVMQNLSQTHCLEAILVEKNKKGIVITLPGNIGTESESELVESENNDKYRNKLKPLDIALSEGGPLSNSVLSFLQDMHSASKNSTLSPGHLFGQVCKKAPRFKGFQQQDSHELLRHLLDGMRAEEIKRLKSGILKAFHLPENINPKTVDEDTKKVIKEYGHQTSHTFVESVFGGQLISTVLCEECNVASQIFEPFLDLSLPITEEKPVRPNLLMKVSKKISDVEEPIVCQFNDKEEKSNHHKNKRFTKKKRKGVKNKNVVEEKWELEKSAEESSGKEEVSVMSKESSENADVEDNTESDVSRLASLEQQDDSQDYQEDKMESCKENDHPVTLASAANDENLCLQMTNLKIKNGHLSLNGEKGNPDILECTESEDVRRNNTDLKNKYPQIIIDSNKIVADQEDFEENNDSGSRNNNTNRSKLEQVVILKSRNSLSPRYQASPHECSIQYCLNQFTAPELLTGNNKFGCENCTKIKEAKLGPRAVGGKKCEKVYTNASKQLLIFIPPAILTLHLKRFQQVGFNLRKVNRHVSFPLILDIAPFCSSLCQNINPNQTKVLYSLYGIVEHSGRLSGGHYTAYVKVRPESGRILSFLQKICFKSNLRKRLKEVNLANSSDRQENAEEGSAEPLPGKWFHISDSHVNEVSEGSVLRCQAYILFYERIL